MFKQTNKGANENAIKNLEIAIVEETRLRLDFLILTTFYNLDTLGQEIPLLIYR